MPCFRDFFCRISGVQEKAEEESVGLKEFELSDVGDFFPLLFDFFLSSSPSCHAWGGELSVYTYFSGSLVDLLYVRWEEAFEEDLEKTDHSNSHSLSRCSCSCSQSCIR